MLSVVAASPSGDGALNRDSYIIKLVVDPQRLAKRQAQEKPRWAGNAAEASELNDRLIGEHSRQSGSIERRDG